jgi:hypothetical protein
MGLTNLYRLVAVDAKSDATTRFERYAFAKANLWSSSGVE